MRFIRLDLDPSECDEPKEIVINPAFIHVIISAGEDGSRIFLTDDIEDSGYLVNQSVGFILGMLS